MNSGPKTTTQTQSTEPPAYVRPYLQQAATESQSLYNKGPAQYYPGQTVTPFSSQTQQALDLTQQRALNGSPVNKAAQGYATDTLAGKYLNANPYLDATFNRAADQVQNRLNTDFAASGRNIDAGRAPAAQELNDLSSRIYGGAYDAERNRMQGTLGMAPSLAAQDYADLGALQGVGAQYEDLASRQMADKVSRYDFEQNAPGVALDQYIARLNNQPGGSSSSTMPYFQNRAAGGLGGAAVGYGLGNQFGQGGWGAALGGLLGAFG